MLKTIEKIKKVKKRKNTQQKIPSQNKMCLISQNLIYSHPNI